MTTPAKTNVSPLEQIRNVSTYNDQLAAGSSLETTNDSLEDNVSAVISQVNRLFNGVVTGNNWFVDPPAPTTFEGGTVRGTIANNQDLHDLERKRVLKRRAMVGLDITIASAGDRFVILVAADLPTNTTAAIGAVTTLGTVVATNATFGTATLDEVTGSNALQPKNLMILTNNATGDVVTRTSDGKQIFGLFQSESSTNGSTITGTTPNRVQISFVVHNAANDDLELIATGDMNGITFDYAYVERHALQDLPEESFLGEGFADTGVSAATRQAAYDNQGTSVVTTTSNATLDIGTGFLWELGDAASANLFRITEGSSGGTTNLTIGTDVDTYDNNAVDVDFNNGITVDNGSDPINIGVTVDQIDFTGNATITGTSGASITVNAVAANANITTTTSGNVVVTSAGLVDVDATTTVTVDGTGISIDGTATSNFSVTGADLVLSTITTGELDLTSAGLMDMNAGANLDIDVTGTFDMLSTGAFSVDGTGASNVTVTSGDLTVSTATTGNLVLTGAVNVDVTSSTGDIDITAATSVDLTSGSSSDITAAAGRDILLTSDVGVFDVNSQDVGHWLDRADFHYFGETARGDNYLTVNAQYTSGTGTTGGWVKITSAATVSGGTIVSSTAGVAATSNPTLTTTGSTSLGAGVFIIIEGASPRSLNGIYEVDSTVTTTVTLRGVGTVDTAEDFTKRQVETAGAASGTIYIATLAVMRSSSTGVFQVATGSASPLTFANLSTGTSSLQQAYETGNTISVSTAEGVIDFSNSTDATDVLTVSRTFAGAGEGITINMGATTTGIGLDVNITSGASGNAVDVANAGTGAGVFVNNTGTGSAITVQDGGSNVVDVTGAGAVTITPTSGTNATVTVAGAGVVDINAGAGGVDIDATGPLTADVTSFSIDGAVASNVTTTAANLTLSTVTSGSLIVSSAGDVDVDGTVVTIDASSGGVSVDATGASNFTVVGAALTLSTTTSGDVVVNAATNVDVDGTAVTVDATAGVSIDAAASSNLSVSAGTLTVSNSSASAADDVAISANAGDVDITSTSGNYSLTATSGSANTSSQNTRISLTNTAHSGATAAGVADVQASRNYWGNGTAGNLFQTINSTYTSATGTIGGSVYVVSASTTTTTTVAAGGFTAGVPASSDATVITAGSGTFAAGDFVLITHSGATRAENKGIFQVLTHTGTTCTIRGPFTAVSTGAEFVARQFRTDTTTGATIQLVTLSVLRANASGNMQIAENFTNLSGISYQDFGTGAVTLANAVTNQAGTAFTAGAFDTQWGISDTQFVEFGDASNNGILTIRGDNNTDAITGVGGTTATGSGQGISFTTGTADASSTTNGGNLLLATGAGDGAGDSGNITIDTGDANSTTGSLSGMIIISTGNSGDATGSSSGGISIFTGGASPFFTTAGDSGGVSISTGAVFGTAVQSGNITISSGSDASLGGSGAAAGSINITGGSSNGASGDFGAGVGGINILASSNSGTATAGSVIIRGGENSSTGSPGSMTVAGGAKTTANGAGGAAAFRGGAGFGTGAGATATVAGGAGGATGAGGAVAVTGGNGGATSGAAGSVSVAGGTPTDGNGGAVSVTGSAGVGTDRAGGGVTVTGGAATGTGSAGSIIATAGTPDSGAGSAGLLDFDAGTGGAGLAGATPQNASAGGAASFAAGTGGAADGGAAASEGADGGAGGLASFIGGTGGAGEAEVDPGAAGSGGLASIAGGVGGAGSGTNTATQTAADGAVGGGVTVAGGRGGAGAAGTVDPAAAGTGGVVNIVGGLAGLGAGTGDNGSGGNVNITGGAADNTGSGAAGTAGIVSIRTPSGPGTTITQSATVARFNNQGTGTGGGQAMDLFTGTAAPSHTASTGSLFLFDNGTTGRVYVNESSGGSGTTWSQLQTGSSTVTRNFFQATFSTGVTAPGTITGAVLTGGVIAVKPSSGFSFDIDAMIFLNGILLMNGSSNEVSSGSGNAISLNAAGPSAVTGDVLTIIYHTNSTSNTA